MGDRQLVVESVSPDSIAGEMGVEPGDIIVSINNKEVYDIIDYRFLTAEDEINILLKKKDGESWALEIEKEWDEDLGITFIEGGLGDIVRCRNRCIFCFVDQMPPNMRHSLYVKDDDYRLSFAQGNFVTLTNVTKKDLDRIITMRLNPLYVSVHTTNGELRARMMNNPNAAKIMEQLEYLAGSGIEFHAQAVLCPGINDGKELDRTVNDLAGLYPSIQSLALVPVGLTGFRDKLYALRSYNNNEAFEIIKKVRRWQKIFMKHLGTSLVYASDEFYLLANQSIPDASCYEGFPQLENGVGIVRLFLDRWEEVQKSLPVKISSYRKVKIITGELSFAILKKIVQSLNNIENLNVELQVISNNTFGGGVTVSGLLTAEDIIQQCDPMDAHVLIIPGVALKQDAPVFLDGVDAATISARLGIPVIIASDPEELVQAVLG